MGNNAYWNVHVAWREMVISMPLRERNDKTFSIVLKNIESMSYNNKKIITDQSPECSESSGENPEETKNPPF